MSVFLTKPQRAQSLAAPQAAAKAAGQALQRVSGKDPIVARFSKYASVAATNPITVEIIVTRQANNTTEPTSTSMFVWFSTTKEGPYGGTQTYGPLNDGKLVATLSANQMYQFQSDENGVLSFDLTKPTAGSIFVRCQIAAQVITQEYIWT